MIYITITYKISCLVEASSAINYCNTENLPAALTKSKISIDHYLKNGK